MSKDKRLRRKVQRLEKQFDQMFAIVEKVMCTTKSTEGVVEDIGRLVADEMAGIAALQERQVASRAGRVNH